MAIIVVGHTKGGVGKSTYATHIAAHLSGQGRSVLLVDADDRQSSQKWIQRRIDAGHFAPITAASLEGNIASRVKLLAEKFDDVVVDCGGTKSEQLLSVLSVAHTLLTPFRPTDIDVDALSYMNDLVHEKRLSNPDLKAFLLTNEAPMNLSVASLAKLLEDVGEMAKDVMPEYQLVSAAVKTRAIYQTAYGEGATADEYVKTNAAVANELAVVFREVLE